MCYGNTKKAALPIGKLLDGNEVYFLIKVQKGIFLKVQNKNLRFDNTNKLYQIFHIY